jgi:hypothetical protein
MKVIRREIQYQSAMSFIGEKVGDAVETNGAFGNMLLCRCSSKDKIAG